MSSGGSESGGRARSPHPYGGRLTRVRRSCLVALGLAVLVAGGPADAHGGGRTPARPVVTGIEPPTEGVTATAVFAGDWRVSVTSTSALPVTVLDAAGRPFIRLTAGGAEGDYGTPAWHDANMLSPVMSRRPEGGGSDTPLDWRFVSRTPTWSWFDPRIRPEPGLVTEEIAAAGAPVRLRDFAVPIAVGEQPARITGYLEFEPTTGVYRHTLLTVSSPVRGLKVGLVKGVTVPTLTLSNATGETVTIVGRDGEPFARIGDSVEVNLTSPTWVETGQVLGFVPAVVSDPQAPPHWLRILDGRSWSWPDLRSRPPDEEVSGETLSREGAVVVKRWTVPLLVGSRSLEVRGVTEFIPMVGRSGRSTATVLVAAAAGLAVFAGVFFFLPRAQQRRRALRPGA